MREFTFKVSAQEEGRRLDLFLAESAAKDKLGLSRTFIQKLILEGRVFLSGKEFRKPHYKIKTDDQMRIIVEEKEQASLRPEEIPLEVIYEDQDLAIINKQPGLVVHPAPGNYEHTLVNALLSRFKNLSDISSGRPGIVHRLDKETSGLMVIAKNNATHLALVEQFANRTIKKKYVALVQGRVEFDENVIELPIGRHPIKRKNMSVSFSEKTKYAKTYYRTLKRAKDYSLLELEPYTGRTHQLRVHLAFIGHPILGDSKYGKNNEFSRLALHAKSIGFMHPSTGKFVEFSSESPKEFEEFLQK